MIEKARESLQTAEMSFQNGWYNSVANRAYFAMYQAFVAALNHHQITPRGNWWSHRELPVAILEYMGYSEEMVQYLLQARDLRVTADYYPERLDGEDVSSLFEAADKILQRVESEIQ